VYFMCGNMAAGKSTYARELARTKNAALLIQDEFLDTLYAGEIRSIQDFVKCSARLRDALSLHIQDLLTRGGFSGPRLSWQHSSSASMVSRDL
jgi:predicted kinase